MEKKKRNIRNIICILAIIAMIAANVATAYLAKNYNGNNMPSVSQSQSSSDSSNSNSSQQPPEMPSGDSSNSSSSSSSSDSSSQQTPPEKPSGDSSSSDSNSSQQPPEMPSGDSSNSSSSSSSSNSNSSQQPPEMPSGDSSNNSSSSSSSDSSSSQQPGNGQMPSAPNGQKGMNNNGIKWYYYLLFAIENLVLAAAAICLIMTNFNKKELKQSVKGSKRLLIFVLSIIAVAGMVTAVDYYALCYNQQGGSQIPSMTQSQDQGQMSSSSSVDAKGDTELTENTTADSKTYTSSTADSSALLINGADVTITDSKVTKTGDSSNTENSEFYGVNSGVLVTANSTATLNGLDITTDATGSNAVFSTGENSKIYISDSTIKTTGESSSRGLDATYGGYIKATNMNITTQGGSCATLATDKGEGTVICSNSTLETNGAGSPIIYSTGDIQTTKITGTSNAAQAVVVEGKNSATIKDSTITCSGVGNRNDVDDCGVMIYQSMSGDASDGIGTFSLTNSEISIDKDSSVYKTAPMFFVTNIDAVINLKNSTLNFGSDVLLSAKGTSEWGNTDSNGGDVTLNATSQTLSGKIELDKLSTLKMTLKKSTYEGAINTDNSAKKVTLTLDADSTFTLTADTYVTSLKDADSTYSNIDLNGYTLYVNGTALTK